MCLFFFNTLTYNCKKKKGNNCKFSKYFDCNSLTMKTNERLFQRLNLILRPLSSFCYLYSSSYHSLFPTPFLVHLPSFNFSFFRAQCLLMRGGCRDEGQLNSLYHFQNLVAAAVVVVLFGGQGWEHYFAHIQIKKKWEKGNIFKSVTYLFIISYFHRAMHYSACPQSQINGTNIGHTGHDMLAEHFNSELSAF